MQQRRNELKRIKLTRNKLGSRVLCFFEKFHGSL